MDSKLIDGQVISPFVQLLQACIAIAAIPSKEANTSKPTSASRLGWRAGNEIDWVYSDKITHKVYLNAPYSDDATLEVAKYLVGKIYPIEYVKYYSSFFSQRKREYYLNQYLWFYEKYGRFPNPRKEKIVDLYPWKGATWCGSDEGYVPHAWHFSDQKGGV